MPLTARQCTDFAGEVSGVAEAEVQAKEWEHTMLQENLDKELKELDKRLEQKEVGYRMTVCCSCIYLLIFVNRCVQLSGFIEELPRL